MTWYAKRDNRQLDKDGEYYSRHILAMTKERLHEKSEIASELAWRDMLIDKLVKHLKICPCGVPWEKDSFEFGCWNCGFQIVKRCIDEDSLNES